MRPTPEQISEYELCRNWFWNAAFKAHKERAQKKYWHLIQAGNEFVEAIMEMWGVPRLSGGVEQFLANLRWEARAH